MKPTNKEYFYIDYRRAIDATKYRVHMLDEKIKNESKPTQEKKEYTCPTCHSEYTIMEVLDSRDSFNMGSGFTCKRCGSILKANPREGEATQEQDDTPARFNKQFGAILSLLQQIDNATIPPSSGEEALANALPLPRDSKLNPGQKSTAVVAPAAKPTAVRGITSGPEKLDINITDDATVTAAAQAEAAAKHAKTQQQNMLPEWYAKSTVTGEIVKAGVQQTATPETPSSMGGMMKEEETEDKKASSGDATLDEYFASLQAEQARELAEATGSDDEEEDEFEDVVVPAVTAPANPAAKRVKIEVNGTDSQRSSVSPPAAAPADAGGDGSGSDDEDEFEDAI